MSSENNYLAINKRSWNQRVEAHLKSAFYDLEGFLDGKSSLKEIELTLLGDIKGKKVLHLQCHFGQDTLSLGRLGAQATGVDLSDKAIDTARELSKKTGTEATFICCDLYELPEHLTGQFDIVFTSYGTIGWLPDLGRWAKVIAHFLKPGGKFVFAEFHPVVWMFDDDFEKIGYNYFNSGAIVETFTGTYADRDAPMELENVMWNHGIGEVVNSLLKNGLEIRSLEEFDYSPYDCFSHTVEVSSGKFRIRHLVNKIPMVYSVVAEKKPL